MDNALFIFAGVVGFFIAKFTSGKKEGKRGRLPSVKFVFKKNTLWLHHWIFFAAAIILLALFDVKQTIWYGYCAGAIIQGWTYKDWYYIFFRNDSYPF